MPRADPHKFVFEIDRAIRTQVIEKLEASPRLALTENVGPLLRGGLHFVLEGKSTGRENSSMLGKPFTPL